MSGLVVTDLHVRYRVPGGVLDAVGGVSLAVRPGSAVGLVGESGSGKSSLARAIVGLTPIFSGSILLDGQPVAPRRGPGGVQMVFQDPIGSLNPSRQVIDIVAESLTIDGVRRATRRERAAEMLTEVGLPPNLFATRRPGQLSGGQAQRVAIARALLAEPAVLVADEPVSGVDVSVQAGLVNLLHRTTSKSGAAMLFVSHDLAIVRALCDDIVVLKNGQVREAGRTNAVIDDPQDSYTRELIEAVPEI
ncbi:ABC transporter ATP-binding protein [Ornithinimicrobium murale]|uniref:ABC transporter ATP-binding protein n=1 Tax=Ornithinimicrobium murale TaxID=1050153 RepID=UPI000E0D7FA6|nr:ATP-binding cassette domain-containing protein [Ornithinimicrobium murale]